MAKSTSQISARGIRFGFPARISYVNWRGEAGERRILPTRLAFEANEWHPEPQWILFAWDLDKDAERGFALSGIDPSRIRGEDEIDTDIDGPEANGFDAETSTNTNTDTNDDA